MSCRFVVTYVVTPALTSGPVDTSRAGSSGTPSPRRADGRGEGGLLLPGGPLGLALLGLLAVGLIGGDDGAGVHLRAGVGGIDHDEVDAAVGGAALLGLVALDGHAHAVALGLQAPLLDA